MSTSGHEICCLSIIQIHTQQLLLSDREGGKIAFESKEAHVILEAFHVEIY